MCNADHTEEDLLNNLIKSHIQLQECDKTRKEQGEVEHIDQLEAIIARKLSVTGDIEFTELKCNAELDNATKKEVEKEELLLEQKEIDNVELVIMQGQAMRILQWYF